MCFFFFSSRRRHTRCGRDWSSDVCSSDLRAAHRCWARPLPASSGKLWSDGTGSPALPPQVEADATRLHEAVLTPATRGNGRDGELAVNDTALPFSAQGRVVSSPGRGDHPGHATPTTTTAGTLMAAAPDVAWPQRPRCWPAPCGTAT